MLTRAWKKIDRFYAILAIVVLVLAMPLVFTVQGIFSSFITAYEIGLESEQKVRVNEAKLSEAVRSVVEREIPKLEIMTSGSVIVEVEEDEG